MVTVGGHMWAEYLPKGVQTLLQTTRQAEI